MSAPEPAARDPRRERLVALLVLGVALVLLVSSVSWFGTGQAGWGIALWSPELLNRREGPGGASPFNEGLHPTNHANRP